MVVVTNQRGLATGALTGEQWTSVMGRLRDLLAAEGAHVDAVEMCPHQHGECACRKPAPGMFLHALADAPWVRPERCAMIGDLPSDVAPALADAVDALLDGSLGQ